MLTCSLWWSYELRILLTVLRPNRSKKHPVKSQNSALKLFTIIINTRLLIFTAWWSLQSRQEVMFSSRHTYPRSINWMPSTWKYHACCYCQNVSCCWVYGCSCCFDVRLPHLSHREAMISPHYKRAISKPDICILFPVGWRMDKKPGAWACRPTWSREMRCRGDSRR